MKAFLLHSSLLVGITAAAFTAATYLTAKIPVDWFYLLFCANAAYFIYTLDRFLYRESRADLLNNPRNAAWQQKHSRLNLATLALNIFAGIALLFYIDRDLLPGVLLLALLALVYVLPLFPGRRQLLDLKVAGLFKPLLLTAIWWGGTLLLPLWDGNFFVSKHEVFQLESRGMLLLIICLVSDVIDYKGDRIAGKQTLPVIFSRSKIIQVCLIITVAWLLLLAGVAFSQNYLLLLLEAPPFIFLGLYLLYYRRLFIRYRSRRFMESILDSSLFLPLLLTIMAERLN